MLILPKIIEENKSCVFNNENQARVCTMVWLTKFVFCLL